MNRLRQLREEMELRQIDVSNATGIDQKTLSNYETGKTNPDSYSLIRLADFYHTSIDYILGRSPLPDGTSNEILLRLNNVQKEIAEIKKLI